MVDINPDLKEVEWRPPETKEALDPVEEQLRDYDFEALHDRIMLAIERKSQVPWPSPKKEKLS